MLEKLRKISAGTKGISAVAFDESGEPVLVRTTPTQKNPPETQKKAPVAPKKVLFARTMEAKSLLSEQFLTIKEGRSFVCKVLDFFGHVGYGP
jgi:hypothetical protein